MLWVLKEKKIQSTVITINIINLSYCDSVWPIGELDGMYVTHFISDVLANEFIK